MLAAFPRRDAFNTVRSFQLDGKFLRLNAVFFYSADTVIVRAVFRAANYIRDAINDREDETVFSPGAWNTGSLEITI